ncbi:hypothetical protein E5288_WYG011611 [Bos mutus]|uniref:Uncharacterized protein n=1 Tax=Bos mutus TaxID=72004 RepID=A0A6B0SFT3_9CETA|nr:hypothetical protein [Bos mutus]
MTLLGCYYLKYTPVAFPEIIMNELVYITNLLLLTEITGELFEVAYRDRMKIDQCQLEGTGKAMERVPMNGKEKESERDW